MVWTPGKANLCIRAVASALKRLKGLGIINWARQCRESRRDDGRYVLEQETNAYAVLPASQWRGYREPPEAPPPAPGTARVLGMVEQADEERRRGATVRARAITLATDPGDRLALALAKLGSRLVAEGRAV